MEPMEPVRRRLKSSTTVKLLMIGLLILLFLIPLSMVDSLVRERAQRRAEAASEVASTWGSRQVLGGPVLVVPYYQHGKDEKGKPTKPRRASLTRKMRQSPVPCLPSGHH